MTARAARAQRSLSAPLTLVLLLVRHEARAPKQQGDPACELCHSSAPPPCSLASAGGGIARASSRLSMMT